MVGFASPVQPLGEVMISIIKYMRAPLRCICFFMMLFGTLGCTHLGDEGRPSGSNDDEAVDEHRPDPGSQTGDEETGAQGTGDQGTDDQNTGD